MEAGRPSEALMRTYQTAMSHNPKYNNLNKFVRSYRRRESVLILTCVNIILYYIILYYIILYYIIVYYIILYYIILYYIILYYIILYYIILYYVIK